MIKNPKIGETYYVIKQDALAYSASIYSTLVVNVYADGVVLADTGQLYYKENLYKTYAQAEKAVQRLYNDWKKQLDKMRQDRLKTIAQEYDAEIEKLTKGKNMFMKETSK